MASHSLVSGAPRITSGSLPQLAARPADRSRHVVPAIQSRTAQAEVLAGCVPAPIEMMLEFRLSAY